MDTRRARILLLACAATAAAAVFISSAAGIEKKDEDLFLPQVQYNASDLRDPFQSWMVKEQPPQQQRPAGSAEPEAVFAPPTLDVQGVFWGGSFPQAIINNTIVREGDSVQNVKILNITKGTIKLQYANREFSIATPGSAQKGQ